MRSPTRHFLAAPLPRRSLSTTSRACALVSSDATTNEVRRRECIATACYAQGCSEGLQGWCALCSVLTALVPFRSNTETSKRDLWVVWLQSRSVSAPQRWHTDLLVCYRPLATPQPEKPSRSQRASAAAVEQIPLPLRLAARFANLLLRGALPGRVLPHTCFLECRKRFVTGPRSPASTAPATVVTPSRHHHH